ncbi:hypothetical protein PG984_009053 [Apiospora sp. TS-2023a]
MVQGLSPIFQCTHSILIASQDDSFLNMAMRPGLFPNLEKIPAAAGRLFYVLTTAELSRWTALPKPTAASAQEHPNEASSVIRFPTRYRPNVRKRKRLPNHGATFTRQMVVACHYWDVAYTTEEDGSRDYKENYSLWRSKIRPDSSEIMAFLHSLPNVEPVYLYVTKGSLLGSVIRCF